MRRPASKSNPAPTRAVAPVTTGARLPVWLLAVMLVLVTMAVYWPALRCDFVNFDDHVYVTANVPVQNGLRWESIKWAWLNPVARNWHPLTVWSHMLDCQLFGLKPWGHHLTSVVLHALNAGLVFALLRQMTGATWRSVLVAALFAVHPLRVESVAWVSERKDVLSGFFGLLALLAYAGYAQKSAGNGPWSVVRSRPRPRDRAFDYDYEDNDEDEAGVNSQSSVAAAQPTTDHGLRTTDDASRLTFHVSLPYLLSLLFFALGLMSKPMLVTWPFVMLLLDYWPLGRFRSPESQVLSLESKVHGPQSTVGASCSAHRVSRFTFHASLRLLAEKIPFFVLAAMGSVLTFVVQERGGAVMAAEKLPLGARVGNGVISYGRYLGKLLWPTDLAAFYPHPGQWPLGKVVLAGGLILALSVGVWVQRRRYPYLLVGWLWFLGTLVPVIGLVQVGIQAMADRYTYIPSLGVLIVAIWGAYDLTRGWRYQELALGVAGGAAVVLCVGLTRDQLGYWKDGEALFRHALEVTGNNASSRNGLGTALDKKGLADEAIRQYQEAIRLKPGYAEAHNNLGILLGKKGQTDEAIRQYQEALRLKPGYADAHVNFGVALSNQGQTDEAIRQFQEALGLRPDHADAHYNLGIALDKEGQMDEAIRQFQAAVRLKPDHAQARYNLGTAFYQQGRIAEAIGQFREAIRLKPDYAEALNSLGGLLYLTGQLDEAIGQYQEALRLKPDYPDAHNNLGIAFYKKDQRDEAIRQFQEALRLKPDNADARKNLDIVLGSKSGSSPKPAPTHP